ncbi:ATP-binding protein [Kerstersia gyiorum]|uniref:ATP-binding protein n=1 Tax=Kerstersia gyiorum TaxID=206506 RepID=UPI0039ECB0A4
MMGAGQADAILGEIRRQKAGRLTVFLGAAPGVGKTCAMLTRARELMRQGFDVVIGIVETHGRSETQALAEGLPLVPRRAVPHQGMALDEMDLDGILARKPAIVLVDELAHRNAPGSRHERRWQDVEELLDAGIDVYTTMNIQHLESVNDLVFQITGIRVTETVPDALFERLRDIRLVDLPARELIERLKQGKVYLPDQASQALRAFFSPSNLTALRELAMQTVADHVDADLRESRAARGLKGIPIQRHVMIAIDGLGESEYLVRAGARIAERRGAPWSVVTVDTGSSAEATLSSGQRGPVHRQDRAARQEQRRQMELDRAFALARALGGETEVLHNTDITQALLDAGAARGAKSIVIGRTRERPIARMFNRTLTQQLLRRGAHYELTIVSTPEVRKRLPRWPDVTGEWLTQGEPMFVLQASLVATVMAALADMLLGLQDLSMVFLVAVMLVASRTRMVAAVMTAALCFLSYDFFFIEPRFTPMISAPRGVATVLLFLAAALIAGRLASRLRMQVVALRAANTHAAAVQDLGRRLSKAADLGQVIAAGSAALHGALRADAWIRIGNVVTPQAPPGVALSGKEQVAADWTQQHGQASGRFTDTLSGSSWWFLPVRSDQDTLGVVGLRFPADMSRLSFEQRRLAESMVDDIAQAALRTRLVAELEAARVTGETERLRSALLSSVSHDLRSPLSSMIGSADSLARYGKDMSEEDQRSLLETIHVEGERLDRYIQNLLDMTRLGQQGLTLTRDWIGMDELVGSASRRLQRYEPHVRVEHDIPADLAPIHVHPALVEQALFNVMENAAKFSPPGQAITVKVRPGEEGQLQIDVSDRGPGIPEDERRRIFDMFYSVERGDRGRHGTGLGLAIVQGIVGAHMGSVIALPGPDGQGTCVRMTLPWEAAPALGNDEEEMS